MDLSQPSLCSQNYTFYTTTYFLFVGYCGTGMRNSICYRCCKSITVPDKYTIPETGNLHVLKSCYNNVSFYFYLLYKNIFIEWTPIYMYISIIELPFVTYFNNFS